MLWLHHVQAPHLGVCGSADSSWSEIRNWAWRTYRWGRRASTGPEKKKKNSSSRTMVYWSDGEAHWKNMPAATFLQNDIALDVSPHFQSECPVSGAKSGFGFIWSKWMWIWTCFITLVVLRIMAVFKEISCDWCYKINFQCTTYTEP